MCNLKIAEFSRMSGMALYLWISSITRFARVSRACCRAVRPVSGLAQLLSRLPELISKLDFSLQRNHPIRVGLGNTGSCGNECHR